MVVIMIMGMCRFSIVVVDGLHPFECPVWDPDIGCPIDDCPAITDPRYCPIDGMACRGVKVGRKAILKCPDGHERVIRTDEYFRRLHESAGV